MSKQPLVILIISLLLSAICWAFMEAEMRIHERSRYVEEVLKKKIQALIGMQGVIEYEVLKWESPEAVRNLPRLALRGVTASGKFAIAFIPSIAAIITLFVIHSPRASPWSFQESILFGASIVMAVIFTLNLVFNVFFVTRYYRVFQELSMRRSKKAPDE